MSPTIKEEDLQEGVDYTVHAPANEYHGDITYYYGTYTKGVKGNKTVHKFSKLHHLIDFDLGHFNDKSMVFTPGNTTPEALATPEGHAKAEESARMHEEVRAAGQAQGGRRRKTRSRQRRNRRSRYRRSRSRQ